MIVATSVSVAAIAYRVALGSGGFLSYPATIVYALIQTFGLGAIIATIGWGLGNRYLRSTRSNAYDRIEWLYAMDIHLNAFVPLFLILYVAQFFLLPFLLRRSFFSTLIANVLYAVAAAAYWYVTFLGYTSMSFLQNTDAFLYPAFVLITACGIATLLGSNLSHLVLGLYFIL